MTSSRSLRRVLRDAGVDLAQCHACMDCTVPCPEELDIPLGTLVQMALYNDEEVLSSRTLWSECVLRAARQACKRGLDLGTIILLLRDEAGRRGIRPPA